MTQFSFLKARLFDNFHNGSRFIIIFFIVLHLLNFFLSILAIIVFSYSDCNKKYATDSAIVQQKQ